MIVKKVAVIDYGMGNIDSVARAVEECGGTATVTNQVNDIESSQYIILPGVGSFSNAMSKLKKHSLDIILRTQVLDKGVPFLGICLGMQVMASKGFEGGETEGLGFIDGVVKRLEVTSEDTRIPHIGWNEVEHTADSVLFKNIESGKDFYFLNSYHLECDEKYIIAKTPYCGKFVSAVSNKLAFGIQFHPEKSQKYGFILLTNFLSILC